MAIEKPISIPLVASELGTTENDLGRLCTHQNINIWAKYKPIDVNKIEELSESDFAFKKYGLPLKQFTTLDALITYYRANPIKFEYQKPKGGALSPYRISDFNGYQKLAERPYLLSSSIMGDIYKGTGNPTVSLKNKDSLPDNNITLNDIGAGNFQFGVVAVKVGALTPKATKVADGLLSTSTFKEAEINLSSLTTGDTYDVLGYIAEIVGGNPIRYYLLEDGDIAQFAYKALSIRTFLSATYTSGFRRVTWDLTIENNNGMAITFQNASIRARYADKEPNDTLGIGEQIVSLGDINIPGNTTYTDNGTINNVLDDIATRGGYVYFSSNNYPEQNTRYDF